MAVIIRSIDSVKTFEVKLDALDIFLMLQKKYPEDFRHRHRNVGDPGSDDSVSVYFEVPSGGDYSGLTIQVTPETPIVVVRSKEETKIL